MLLSVAAGALALGWAFGRDADDRERPVADTPEVGGDPVPGAEAATRRQPASAARPGPSGDQSPHEDRASPPRGATVGGNEPAIAAGPQRPEYPPVRWRDSIAVGEPEAGRLIRGVRLPREGRDFFTWDPIKRTKPNRGWRRYATDDLIRVILRVLDEHRDAYPRAPRLGIGDLSRTHGGDFGPQFGYVGHASHQNGLDADIYYPLKSGLQRSPQSVEEIDLGLSQDLVDRFVAAGAERVFVGPNTGLTGPPGVVQALPYHDNHIHLRIPPTD